VRVRGRAFGGFEHNLHGKRAAEGAAPVSGEVSEDVLLNKRLVGIGHGVLAARLNSIDVEINPAPSAPSMRHTKESRGVQVVIGVPKGHVCADALRLQLAGNNGDKSGGAMAKQACGAPT
jgi:hypothetical protein